MTTRVGYERLRQVRRAMLGGLSGTVVEVGAGEGRDLADLPGSADWIGIEPSSRARRRLAEKAAARGFRAPLAARAEALPVADGSIDVVLAVVALCSVDDLDRALNEARRVLRPGGRLVFLEHVAAPAGSGLRVLQRAATPVTAALDRNCHLARDPLAAAARTGFTTVSVDRYDVTGRVPGIAWPFVMYEGAISPARH
ncbi:class I SAM-dependent methyltransferase [Tersicoccus sp. MR15.9]|uniref:class I SAM-dependent methyltransferase n=1 Tax=Tersicoccus mangrovi TaxID=3121635 RepID=UPI002FE5327A